MREIRRLRAEDMLSMLKLKTVVFNGRTDFSKEENRVPGPLAHPPEWHWGVFEDNRLVSGLVEIEYLMRFDGHSVPMSGIGGVGTLPEARKGGLVRALFERLLPEAYERGVVFSSLSPFSHDFYRKFGYENACARKLITLSISEFSKLKLRGEFIPVFPGDDTAALNELHRAYIADINHGICRDSWPDMRGWKIVTDDDPYASGMFFYLWRNEAGENKGYIQYEDVVENGEHIAHAWELMFLGRDSLYGVLSLVSGLSAKFKKFRWLMPDFLDPADFIADSYNVEQRIILRDMTRIINVKEALTLMRRPCGEGAYVVEVEDGIIAANKGRFLVEYGPSESRVSLTRKDADLRCDIPSLSQLVTGYRSLEHALRTRRTGLEVPGNRETLDKVFTQRPQQMTEYF